jgi:flagellar basal-body rod modification protein FlgD
MESASVGIQGQSGAQAPSGNDRFGELGTDGFLKLLIAELQNQDPMSPMENTEILQQVSQIRQIQSNESLVTTLDAVKVGQNMATATGLLGAEIVAMTDASEFITGKVDRVTFEDGVPRVHVGDHAINLKNISAVLPESTR